MNAQSDLRARRGRKYVILKYPLRREPGIRVRRPREGCSLQRGRRPENVVGNYRDVFRELCPSAFSSRTRETGSTNGEPFVFLSTD